MVVKHNRIAMNNERWLSSITGRADKRSEKLSSGYRINCAADDAAGLSISEKMRKQIRGLTQASANAQDGISLCQTAEGALHEVNHMLHRINELAVKAANGTNSDIDRGYLQKEVEQIKEEVNRVAASTEFNEIKLLDGSCGYRDDETATHSGTVLPRKSIAKTVTYNVIAAQTPMGGVTSGGNDKLKELLKEQIVPNAVEAIVDTFPNTFGYLKNSHIGIGLNLYSAPASSVLASVSVTPWGVPPDTIVYSLNVNTAKIQDTAEGRKELERTVAHEMMHALMGEALTSGITGTAADGSNVASFPTWFIEGTAQTISGAFEASNNWITGFGGLGLDPGFSEQDIELILSFDPLGSGSSVSEYGTGYLGVMYLGYLIAGGTSLAPQKVAEGLDVLMNDIRGGSSLNQAIANRTPYSGISDFQNKFGKDGASFVKQLMIETGKGTGSLIANDYTASDLLPDTALTDASLENLFKLDTTSTLVSNKYPAGYTVISGGAANAAGAEGPDYQAANPGGGTAPGTGGNQPGGGGNQPGGGGTIPGGTVNNPGGGNIPAGPGKGRADGFPKLGGISLQIGAEASLENSMKIYIEAMNTEALGISDVDIGTQDGAINAISAIGNAIHRVSAQRSGLGAYQNRLEHTVYNLDNVVENTAAAESRIRHADMATEMMEWSNLRIICQAGQAMLAQSGRINQGVLSLLQ